MAVVCTKQTFYRYSGLSTDTKPGSEVEESSTFDELDTGREFEYRGGVWIETISSVKNNRTVRMVSVGDITYVGKAAPGTLETQSLWQIMKLDETTGLSLQWAGGSPSFTNRWDQRTLLTYS